MNLVFIGPQGSGKGTQAHMLAKKLSIPHISVGEIFRDIEQHHDALGRQVKKLVDHGMMVPDRITNAIVKKRLAKKDAAKGFILDGYPRDVDQAKVLSKYKRIDSVVLIDISDKEAVRRIAARRSCPKCHEGYNNIFLKPKKTGICDKCGTKLVVREDDKPAFIKVRLQRYHAKTGPILDFYNGILVKIDGEQPIPKVASDISKKIRALVS